MPEFSEGGVAWRRDCSDGEVRDALQHVQQRFHLRATGELDAETKQRMSMGRCGNRDDEVGKAGNQGLRTKPEDSNQPRPRRTRVRRRALDLIAARKPPVLPSPRRGNPLELEWERGTSLLKRILLPKPEIVIEEYLDTSRGRDRLLDPAARDEIIAQRRERIESKKSKIRQTQTDSDNDDGHRRLTVSPEDSQDRRSEPATRNRRSVVEGSGTRLIPGSGNPITWRLVAASGKIPEYDQFASLMTAFRMWTEVTPIGFEEETEGDIHNIHIPLAFGKGKYYICKY